MDIYIEPPNVFKVDQGSQFVSESLRGDCKALDPEIEEVPSESPSSIGMVEGHHAPLRAAYLKLRRNLCERMRVSFRMAVKACNDSTGPMGLCPTLLVLGTKFRWVEGYPAGNTTSPQESCTGS